MADIVAANQNMTKFSQLIKNWALGIGQWALRIGHCSIEHWPLDICIGHWALRTALDIGLGGLNILALGIGP
jgi:hypothetical protein